MNRRPSQPFRAESFPGWKMSKAQHDLLLFKLWPKAIHEQGWSDLPTAAKEAKRKEITADVFKGPKSWKDINRTDEFGLIKNRLSFLAGELKGAMEDGDPDQDAKRRLLYHIRTKRLPCLALYQTDPQHYLNTLLIRIFKKVPGTGTIEDLRPDQLQNLIYTLSARTNEMRNDAGDTVHQMNQRANLACEANCGECRGIVETDAEIERIEHEPVHEMAMAGHEDDVTPF